MQENKNESRHCRACSREVESYMNFCPRCGVQLKDDALVLTPDEIKKLEESGVLRPVSEAEWSRFVLRALISYHERITMGEYPSLDCWKRGLEFAVSCVEEKIKK